MNDPIAVLNAAALLIAEHGHCKAADAHNADGIPVMPTDPTARAWSVTGALLLVGKAATGRAFLDALHAFGKAVGAPALPQEVPEWAAGDVPGFARQICEAVWEWEDRPQRTAAHVLSAFARAAEGNPA